MFFIRRRLAGKKPRLFTITAYIEIRWDVLNMTESYEFQRMHSPFSHSDRYKLIGFRKIMRYKSGSSQ